MEKELLEHQKMIVAVTKNHSLPEIRRLYDLGFRVFGENRVQELLTKVSGDLPGAQWHMIGHLQANKVRHVVRYCTLIHSVDSLALLRDIDKEARRQGKAMPVLIQVNVAAEATKFGIAPAQLAPLLAAARDLTGVRIRGIMVIGPHVQDPERIREVFTAGRRLFDSQAGLSQANVSWDTLSMGMSQDYKIALECGTTLMRLGHILFAEL